MPVDDQQKRKQWWESMAKESNDAKIKEQLRQMNRRKKRERAIASVQRPERDLLEMSEMS